MISNIVTKKFKLLFSLILVLAIALHPAFAVTSYADTFSDVKYEDWFYNSVDYVSDANIMQGYTTGRFGASDVVTREQFASILYRLSGSPAVNTANIAFCDVPSGTWFTKAVLWANANSIVSGYDDTTFGTGDSISREQLVSMLYRYAEYKSLDISRKADITNYPDAQSVSSYARESLQWALGSTVISGRNYGNVTLLTPSENTTRAECAAILQRFMERCMTYFNGHIVAIDAGHQRKGNYEKEPLGPGASEMKAKVTSGTQGKYTGVEEYVVNLDVSLMLRDELESRGYQVVMIRENHDVNISNAERAAIANNSGAEIFIRIHCNGVDNTSVRGALTMAPTSSNPYVGGMALECKRLSQVIIDEYCAATGFRNRGIQYADNMSGINWCKIPVTIVEMGFMSNKEDDQMLVNPAMQVKMAEGIANGIDAYFE